MSGWKGKRPPLYAVVMAGGQGTRFWPVSRTGNPKQFLCLDGRRTLLQQTVQRLVPLVGWERLLVVTHHAYARKVRMELPQLPKENVLPEPEARNTLPCLLFAAATIRLREPGATMIAAPADHLVQPVGRWRQALREAAHLAESEKALVTLGIPPTRAETGYGYIECGERLESERLESEAYRVRRFREKPDSRTARRFVRSNRFLWNSGVFVWTVEAFWQAAGEVAAQTTSRFEQAFLKPGRAPRPRVLAALYQEVPSISVDHAVLEPLSIRGTLPIIVLKSAFAWSDVGSWAELGAFLRAGSNGNAGRGRFVSVNSSNNLVWSPARLVALVGMDNTIVVDTPDALLVCRKEDAQAIRQVVEQLRQKKWTQYL
ncbi:Mannose-1-phosphate guanylyltransferase RfbM [bacterium HR30]|nr:Mannose-1-phosphate guanylyltransferase RfbM [bacterium HR30]